MDSEAEMFQIMFHYIFSTFYDHLFFVNYQPLGCSKWQGTPFILHCQAYELQSLSKGASAQKVKYSKISDIKIWHN